MSAFFAVLFFQWFLNENKKALKGDKVQIKKKKEKKEVEPEKKILYFWLWNLFNAKLFIGKYNTPQIHHLRGKKFEFCKPFVHISLSQF